MDRNKISERIFVALLLAFCAIFSYSGVSEKEQTIRNIFIITICLEMLFWFISIIIVSISKQEKLLVIAIILQLVDAILGCYQLWLFFVDGKIVEYAVMILGMILSGLWGYLISRNKSKEKKKEITKSAWPLIMGIIGIWFSRILGALLNQDQVRIMGEAAIDIIMMSFSFGIGAGIARLKNMDEPNTPGRF